MADINYGYGTGLNNNQTSSGYFYTVQVSSSVEETFDDAGNVDTIKIYNTTTNGRLRIWKGTISGDSFVFDDYTEIVDIDLTGKGTGWLTLTAPTDFTAFAVTANTALGFYSHSTAATGLIIGRGTGVGNMFYGYNSADPVYSGNLALSNGTTGRLEIKVEGSFPGPTITDVETDEDVSDKDTNVTITGTSFEASQGTGKVEISDNAVYASGTKVQQTESSWSDTAIDITVDMGALGPGTRYVWVTNNSAERSAGFAIALHRAHAFGLAASANIAASGEDTTRQLTLPATKADGDFDGGRIQDDENPGDTVDVTDGGFREDEWCLQAVTNSEDSAQYEFRVLLDDEVPDTITVTPKWTVSSGRTVNCSTEATEVTEAASSINRQRGVNGSTEAIALTENAATVSKEFIVSGATEAIEVTEAASIIKTDRGVNGSTEEISAAESAATVNRSREAGCNTEQLEITENTAVVSKVKQVAGATEAIEVTENAAAVSRDVSVVGSTEAIEVTENTANVGWDRIVGCATNAIELIEAAAIITTDASRTVTCLTEVISLTVVTASIWRWWRASDAPSHFTVDDNTYHTADGWHDHPACFVYGSTEVIQISFAAGTVDRDRVITGSTEALEVTPGASVIGTTREVIGASEQLEVAISATVGKNRIVACSTDVIEITVSVSIAERSRNVGCSTEAIEVSANTAIVTSGLGVAGQTVPIEIDENMASVNAEINVAAITEQIQISGTQSSVDSTRNVIGATKAMQLNTNSSTITTTRGVGCGTEELEVAASAVVSKVRSVGGAAEALVLTANAAGVNSERQVAGITEPIEVTESGDVDRVRNVTCLTEEIVLEENRKKFVSCFTEAIELVPGAGNINREWLVACNTEQLVLNTLPGMVTKPTYGGIGGDIVEAIVTWTGITPKGLRPH